MTSTPPPPPPRILFSSRSWHGYEEPKSFAIDPEGRIVAENRIALPADQVSAKAGLFVTTKAETQTNFDYFACGVAGCTSGMSTTQSDLIVGDLTTRQSEVVLRGGYHVSPSLSPDGRRVAFITNIRDGDLTAAVADLATGEVRLIRKEQGGRKDHEIAWSPNADQLVVARQDNNIENPRVDLIRPDGALIRTLVQGKYWSDLSWSPDGRFVVAVHFLQDPRFADGHITGPDLWVIPVDGSAPRRITHFAPKLPMYDNGRVCDDLVPRDRRLREPVFSPDGTKIAFLTNYDQAALAGQVYDIALVNVDGAGFRVLRKAAPGKCIVPSGHERNGGEYAREEIHLLGWDS